MEKSSVGVLIATAMVALLGAILVGIVAEQTQDKTTLTIVSSEAIDISSAKNGTGQVNPGTTFTLKNAPTGWKQEDTDCRIASYKFTNYTGTVLTETTDYVLNTQTGVVYFKNTNPLNITAINTTYAYYQYCPDEYIAEGWQRTITNLVPGFFAVGILVGVAFVIFFVMKKEGISLDLG